MTTVTFFRFNGSILGYRAKGHAGYDDYGHDIVCAAVSALCQTCELGLERVAGAHFSLKTDEEKGLRELQMEDLNDCAATILRTLEEGLTEIAKQYPGFVRITYMERRQTS